MTTKTKSPNEIATALEWCEVDSSLAPDCRALLRDERLALVIALRSGDGMRIRAAAHEALRVARMWHVTL